MGEEIEKFRVGGGFASGPEITGSGHDAPPEMVQPEPIRHDAGKQHARSLV